MIFYLLFKLGSQAALSIFVGLLAVVSIYLLYRQLQGAEITKAFILIFGSLVVSVVWSPRPQMLSFALLTLTTFILLRGMQTKKTIWLLLPVFILWSNLHGGYALGLLLLGSTIAGEVLDKILNPDLSRLGWKELRLYAAVTIACYLVTAINPNGINTWLIPFKTVGVQGLQNLISEWASPNFHDPVQLLFLVFVFSVFWIIGLSKKSINPRDLLLISIFGIMAFISRRNIGPFVIVACPILSRYIGDAWLAVAASSPRLAALEQKMKNRGEKRIPERMRVVTNIFILFALGAAALVKVIAVTEQDFVNETISTMYPKTAAAWITSNKPAGNLLNEYDWGGYLIWELRDYPVFIDGRTDLFGDEIIGQWLEMINCGPAWDTLVRKWSINLLLIRPDRPLVRCGIQNGWSIAYQDDHAVVLTPSR